MRSTAVAKKDNGRKRRKVLDLNTKILISICDELMDVHGELREHRSIMNEHTTILKEHTAILQDHSGRITAVEKAVVDLRNDLRSWVSHFDRDFLRLANDFDAIRVRVEKCESKLSL